MIATLTIAKLIWGCLLLITLCVITLLLARRD